MRPAKPSEASAYDTAEPAKGSARQMQLAEARTRMAEDRTIMAVERTFAGWIRTAFAAMAIGLGFHALFAEVRPDWLPRLAATGLMLMAVWIAEGGAGWAGRSLESMRDHVVAHPRSRQLRWIAHAVSSAALLLAVCFWAF